MVDILLRGPWSRKLGADAERSLNDLFFFGSFYWGLDLEEKPHREMCDVLAQNELGSDTPFTMLVVPRGTYKSSILRAYAVWKQLRQIHLYENFYHRIVIGSATLRLGESTMLVIENQLRYNQRIISDFGALWQNKNRELVSSKSDAGITLAPRILAGPRAAIAEPSFWIGSIKMCQTGLHADEAIIDDLNTKENVSTVAQRAKTHEHWRLLFPLIGSEDGSTPKIAFVATPWHDDDVRGMILREERQKAAAREDYKSRWSVLHRGAIEEDGTPFFPSKYPLPRLEELRAEMGPRAFAANFLCDPVGDSGFVDDDMIVFKVREFFPALRDGRITVDPHQHKEAKELGCYAAIVVAGYDRWAKMWVQEARGSRAWDTQALISALFDLAELYPSYPIFMEDAHMAHFAHAVSMEEARRSEEEGRRVHLRINYVPVDVKTSKYDRWRRLHPRFVNRAIFFSDDIAPDLKNEIKEELVRGEASRFNDFLDALAMAETGVRPRVKKDGSFEEVRSADRARPGLVSTPAGPPKISFRDAFGKDWVQ